MFDYDLSGKQVILVLEPHYLPPLESCGIKGSPLVARIHRMEDSGLWLENPHFNACPTGTKKIYGPHGENLCMAYVFIPTRAIISVIVFPEAIKDIDKNSGLHSIGFDLTKKK